MRRNIFRWPLLAILTAFSLAYMPLGAPSALAQATTSGTITGTVADPIRANF